MNKHFCLRICFLALFLCLFSCSPTSNKDYQTLAGGELNRFSNFLKKIHDPKQLKNKQKSISKRFVKLTGIMIDYHSYLEKHPEVDHPLDEKTQLAAQKFKEELYRIYELDGGRELIEEAQKDAYTKLSLFEQSITQTRIDMFKSNKPISKELK